MSTTSDLLARAAKNLGDTLRIAIEAGEDARILVVYDRRSPLASLVADAYKLAVPGATFVDFDEAGPEKVIAALRARPAGDTVVLVQSASFRLDEFRIRIEMFARGLRAVEHVHLARNKEDQFAAYVDSLAYDPAYYRPLGAALKAKLEAAKGATVTSRGGAVLRYDGPFEPAKPNLGDYRGLKNIGGTFPIGEVFTEPTDLSRVNGDISIRAFGGLNFHMRHPAAFPAHIEAGILTAPDAPAEFQLILQKISSDEPVQVREFGLGLNRAFNRDVFVDDITAYERCVGLHLSLGAKHTVYKKEGIRTKGARHHVDIFVDVESVELDGEKIFDGVRYFV
jgi:aminopeptidase